MRNNLPTISVRDIEIQRREDDLVVGTFGRGIYIVDDYSPLRTQAADLDDFQLFAPRDPWLYIEGDVWGGVEKGSIGHAFFTAPNPEFGAVFRYYVKDGLKSKSRYGAPLKLPSRRRGGYAISLLGCTARGRPRAPSIAPYSGARCCRAVGTANSRKVR